MIKSTAGVHREFHDWAARQPDTSPAALWATCPRADWLAWYLGRLASGTRVGSPEHRRATMVAVLCARADPRHTDESEGCLAAIDRWLAGEPVDLRAVQIQAHGLRTVTQAALAAVDTAADDKHCDGSASRAAEVAALGMCLDTSPGAVDAEDWLGRLGMLAALIRQHVPSLA